MPLVLGFKTTIKDPELLNRYSRFIKESTKKSNNSSEKELVKLLDQHKQLIGSSLRGSISRAGTVKQVPSFVIRGEELEGAAATAFGKFSASTSLITNVKNKASSTGNLVSISNASFRLAVQNEDGQEETFSFFKNGQISEEAKRLFKGGANIFRILKSDSSLFNTFYKYSKNLQITQQVGKRIEVYNLSFRKGSFKFRPFSARLQDSTIHIFLLDSAEKALVKDIQKTQTLILQDSIAQFNLKAGKVQKGKVEPVDLTASISATYPSGGSIPMSRAVINIPNRRKKTDRERTISDAQLTAILHGLMKREMPQGPVGGPPLSATFLTRRTDRFLNSVQATVNHREDVMTYRYNPIYYAHIPTTRNPDRQIEDNLRQIAQRIYGRKFRILALDG